MTAFPPGARNFQLPSPYRGVVYFHDGQVFVQVDGRIVGALSLKGVNLVGYDAVRLRIDGKEAGVIRRAEAPSQASQANQSLCPACVEDGHCHGICG